jgi:hypothetical protein
MQVLFERLQSAQDDSAKAEVFAEGVRIFAPVIFGAIEYADGDQVMKLMEAVFAYTNCDGHDIEPRLIDATFADANPATMWKVFFEGLRVNYGSFFHGSASTSSAPTKI